MAFLTEQEFRTLRLRETNHEILSEKIQNCLQKAIDDLTVWCGSVEVEAVAGSDDSASDNLKFKTRRFRYAQECLAFAEIIPHVADRFKAGGFQVQSKDLDDTGASLVYEDYEKTRKRIADLHAKAKEFVADYLLTETTTADAVPVAFSSAVPVSVEW